MNTRNVSSFDDDEDDWVPLDSNFTAQTNKQTASIQQHVVQNNEEHYENKSHAKIDLDSFRSYHTTSSRSRNNTPTNNSVGGRLPRSSLNEGSMKSDQEGNAKLNKTLNNLRKRHGRNLEMKENFVNRPLVLFPRLFFYHLVTEFWNSSRTIRIGIIFILTGVCLQLSSFAIIFSFTLSRLPQMIISSIIIGFISYIILFHLDNPLSDFFKSLSPDHCKKPTNTINDETTSSRNEPHHILLDILFTCLEFIDGNLLRRICICIFFIVPILMEMRALMLLTSLFIESLFVQDLGFILRWTVCWAFVLIELVVLVPIHFHVRTRTVSSLPKQGAYSFGPIVLELKHQTKIFDMRIHLWVYLYVMALVGTTLVMGTNQVHKPFIILAAPFLLATGSFLILSCNREGNEGNLFLNILRRALRLSLYDVFQLVGEDIAEDEILQLNILRWIVDLWAGTQNTESPSSTSQGSQGDFRTQNDYVSNRESFAASRMSFESNEQTTSNTRRSGATRHENIDIGNHERASSQSNFCGQIPRTQGENSKSTSAGGLSLPSFIHVDERAKPAVQSYKEAVASFPPSRNACIILAVIQRCPALLLVLFLHLFASHYANCTTIILIPMMSIEFMRIKKWRKACCTAFMEDDDADRASIAIIVPKSMEPMQILLSGDDYSHYKQGASMQIWINIKNSVVALESSLTAVKCVNTANIATDVAFDVMSLAKLGFEVKEKGIPYGVSLLVKDLFQFHLEKTMNENNEQARLNQSGGSTYSKTAVNLVNNSKMLSKNIGELMDDGQNQNNILHPVIDGVTTLFGRGWLWGKDEESDNNNIPSETREGQPGCDQAEGDIDDKSTVKENEASLNISSNDENRNSEKSASIQSDFIYDIDSDRNHSIHDDKPTQQELPCNNDSHIVQEHLAGDNHGDHTKVDNSSTDQQGDSDDGAKALSAGLAIVAGVIAGGVAIALKSDENARNQNNPNRESNVTIDRLDDDDED